MLVKFPQFAQAVFFVCQFVPSSTSTVGYYDSRVVAKVLKSIPPALEAKHFQWLVLFVCRMNKHEDEPHNYKSYGGPIQNIDRVCEPFRFGF